MESNDARRLMKRWMTSVRDAIALETVPLTIVFWLAAAVMALAFGLCRYPPMVDYPQHVAIGAVLRRLSDPESAERAFYFTNFVSYNGGIEVAIAFLSRWMRPEVAGRVLLAAHAIVFPYAALSLCKVRNRPRWHALLTLPIVYNYTTGWGFANFAIAVPIALLVVSYWLRIVDGCRAVWLLALTVLLALVVAYTHVLVMLCICVVVAVVSLTKLLGDSDDSIVTRIQRLWAPGVVMAPAVGYSLVAYHWTKTYAGQAWEHAWAEGSDDPLWHKMRYVLFNATGNFADSTDQILLASAILIGTWIAIRGASARAEPRARWIAFTFLGLYFLVPKVFIATFHIYARFLPFAGAFAVAALPSVGLKDRRWLAGAAGIVAVMTAANCFYKFQTVPEVDDALAIIDDAPAGHSLIGVTYDPSPRTLFREIWVHLPALYQARKQGLIAYTFMRNESPPVHYKPGKEPARAPGGIEWRADLYDPHAHFARTYDLVLVRTWLGQDGATVDPRDWVFQDLAPFVKQISRRGRFFLYDASGLARWPDENVSPEADGGDRDE